MIAGLFALAGALGVVAWYMQRQAPRRVALSFARLLPDPPENTPPEPRFNMRPPVRSPAFWFHLIAVIMALVALWLDYDHNRATPTQAIGVRFVVDTSYSMSVLQNGETRLELAMRALDTHRKTARELAADSPYCDEVILVSNVSHNPINADLALAQAVSSFRGADKAALVSAARAEAGECGLTHTVVLTDQTKPAIRSDDANGHSPALLWHQIGDPSANAGLFSVSLEQAGFLEKGSTLSVVVAVHGKMQPPTLTLEAPDGATQELRLTQSLDRNDRYVAQARIRGTGEYRALLETQDALSGDNQVVFQVFATNQVTLNWNLPGFQAPPGAGVSSVGLTVIPVSDATPEDLRRPILLTRGEWPARASPGLVGAFVGDHPLVDPLNLDIVESFMPTVPQQGLPNGFQPVLTNDKGEVLIAERIDPPGFIVPEPRLDGHPDSAALSLTVFLSALDILAGGTVQDLPLIWQEPSGQIVQDAWKETDTARALGSPPDLTAPSPDARISRQQPVWPYLVLAVLVLLAGERFFRVFQAFRMRSRHAV